MDIGNLRGANDILPAVPPRNTHVAGQGTRSVAASPEPQDVFSRSEESRSVAAFVEKAESLDRDREDRVASAIARLRGGALDGNEVDKLTAEKILQAILEGTLLF
jgi:hypothetical protein